MLKVLLRFAAVAALTAATAPSFASYRAAFVARHEGRTVAGAEVCFHRAGDTDAPLELFVQYPEVRCVTADEVLAIPPGRWLYYLRHKDGLIGARPSVLTYRTGAGEPDLYNEHPVEMRPAATVDFSKLTPALAADDRLAVFVSNRGTDHLPQIVPLPSGETEALVPAEMPVMVLRLRHSRVTHVSPALLLEKNGRHELKEFPPDAPGRGTVLTWVAFDEEARTPAPFWDKMPAPVVTLTAGDRQYSPAIAPRPMFGSDGALMVFHDVPLGAAEVKVSGAGWKTHRQRLQVAGGVSVARTGLQTRPVSSLAVRWSADSPRLSGGESCSAAEGQAAEARRTPSVRLLTCDGLQRGLPDVTVATIPCRPAAVATRTDAAASEAWFEEVVPGTYAVELEAGGVTVRRSVDLAPSTAADAQRLDVELTSFRVFGRLTLRGRPVRARLEFAGGSTVSDDAGLYDVRLAEDPRNLPVRVTPCGDDATVHVHVPDAPLVANSAHDIDLRPAQLTISVLDSSTGRGVKGLQPWVAISKDGETADGSVEAPPLTDEDGRSVLVNAPAGMQMVTCVASELYARKCSEPFTIAREETGSVTLKLQPYAHHGRIQIPRVEAGRLYFTSPSGAVTEMVTVAKDGSFRCEKPHFAPEYAVFASSGPLAVLELPHADGATLPPLNLALPNVPRRTIDIRSDAAGPRRDAVVRMIVGERYVPPAALDWHQNVRGSDSRVYGGGPLVIRDLLASGAIAIALGPPPDGMPDLPLGTDAFLLPAFAATFVRDVVPPDGRLTFSN